MKMLKEILLFFVISFALLNPAYSQVFHGAVAVSNSTGIAGGSFDAGSVEDAKKSALRSCISKHKGKANDCAVKMTLKNTCASVYWSKSAKRGGVGTGSDKRYANQVASHYCGTVGNDCVNILSFCTSRVIY